MNQDHTLYADSLPINTRTAWRPVLRPITAVVIAAQLALVLQPLSVMAQDKGQQSISPLAQNQLNRINLMSRDIEAATAQKQIDSASPADKASTDLARIEEVSKTLHADLRARGLATLPAKPTSTPGQASDKEAKDIRAIGPNMRIETQRSPQQDAALRLQDSQRTQQLADLKDLLGRQQTAQAATRADFAATRQELEQKKLPAEILARATEAAAQFEQRAVQFNQIALKLQNTAPDSIPNQPAAQQNVAGAAPNTGAFSNTSSTQALDELHTFFAQYPSSKRAAPSFDPQNPKKLPWSTPEPTKRAPAETKTAWLNNLHKDYYAAQSTKVAQAGGTIGGLQFTQLPEPSEAPTPADLAETDEVKLTPAIRAQATALGNNPVQIHNWVRNTLEWAPTWGAIQSAQDTLDKRRGNATDIASLEIALLRAAGIPARYQYGTIELTTAQLQNWAGGTTSPEAAQQIIAQGGIANRGLVEGGRFAKVRMEHVWVQAYVNWAPSRGAKQGGKLTTPETVLSGQAQHVNPNGQFNAWVPLDASFKQYSYSAGLDLKTTVPLDANALLSAAQQGATVNANYVQNLNQQGIAEQLRNYQNRLQAAINSSPTGASSTVADVLGAQTIKTSNPEMLAGTLQYPVVSLGSQLAELPEAMRWKITFKLYAGDFAKANDSATLSHKVLMSQIGNRRISVSPVGSTEADRNLLSQYASTGATSVPLYLIRQNVQLKLDEQILTEAPSQRMGDVQWWNYVLEGPNFGSLEEDFKYETAVGDAIVFGVDSAGITLKQVSERFNAVNPNSAHENLHHLNLGYFARSNWSDQGLAKTQGFVTQRMPSVGLFASPLTIQYSWGIPRKGSFQGYAIDIRRLTQSSVAAGAGADALSKNKFVDFNIQLGLKNSYLEGSIFEEIFDLSKGRGFSAVALLSEASNNGVGVYEITQTNIGEFLTNATALSYGTRQAINNYVDAGYIVMAPVAPVDAVNWKGEGYVALDPETGSGAYIIGSGANGGELLECKTKSEPLAKSLGDRINTIIILAAVAALIAAGIILAPPSGGSSLGGAGVAVAKMMAAIGMTTLAFSGTAQAAGGCPTDKCHRGRFQAQGGTGSLYTETSVKWEKVVPLTKTEAYTLLDQLASQLTPRQLEARATGFAQMKNLIVDLPSVGACIPFSRSKPKPDLPSGVRVDVEIKAGQAFTD